MKKIVLMVIGLMLVTASAFATPNFSSPTWTNPDVTVINADVFKVLFREPYSDADNAGNFFEIHELDLNALELNSNLMTLSFKLNSIFDSISYDLYDSIGSKISNFTINPDNGQRIYSLLGIDLNYFLGIEGIVSGSGAFYTVTLGASHPAVPVPAAALLLGAGLLGIVGIRRKQVS